METMQAVSRKTLGPRFKSGIPTRFVRTDHSENEWIGLGLLRGKRISRADLLELATEAQTRGVPVDLRGKDISKSNPAGLNLGVVMFDKRSKVKGARFTDTVLLPLFASGMKPNWKDFEGAIIGIGPEPQMHGAVNAIAVVKNGDLVK